jgi:arsenate reductase
MDEKRNVILFLCVANSARSQMAEGIARTLAPRGIETMSAGSIPKSVHPLAIEALREVGIDITSHSSKSVESIPAARVRTAITLCSDEVCPVFFGNVERLHWPHPDPAAATGSREEQLASFRKVRDEIRGRLRRYFATLATAES